MWVEFKIIFCVTYTYRNKMPQQNYLQKNPLFTNTPSFHEVNFLMKFNFKT